MNRAEPLHYRTFAMSVWSVSQSEITVDLAAQTERALSIQ